MIQAHERRKSLNEVFLVLFGRPNVCSKCKKTFYCNDICSKLGRHRDTGGCYCRECVEKLRYLSVKNRDSSQLRRYWKSRLLCYVADVESLSEEQKKLLRQEL